MINWHYQFSLIHSATKFTAQRLRSAPYLRLKNIKGTTIGKIWCFFQKKYSVKKSHEAEKPKTRSFRLKKRFLQSENFKKMQGGTLLQNSKNGGPFGLTCTFGSIKNYGLVRELNPRSPASENLSRLNKWTNCKKWTIQSEIVNWKRKQDGNVPSRRHI